jgi:membrane protease YdiL (CAAX protease family)
MVLGFLAAWLSLLIYLAFALPAWRRVLLRLSGRFGDWIILALLLPYLLAVRFRPPPLDLLRLVIYLALPTLLLRLRPKRARPMDVVHVLTILAIWIPVEPSLFTLLAEVVLPTVDLQFVLDGIALVPRADALLIPGVSLPIGKLTAVSLALLLYTVRYPIGRMGFAFRFAWLDLWRALQGLGAFAVVGAPIGLLLGFLRFDLYRPSLVEAVTAVLGGYLLIALPEEILFRGAIQNLTTQRLGRWWDGLLIAAPVFGLAHINNATPGFAEPNWAYALMATIAALAYGWVWKQTHKVTASALTHTAVNLIWWLAFHQ